MALIEPFKSFAAAAGLKRQVLHVDVATHPLCDDRFVRVGAVRAVHVKQHEGIHPAASKPGIVVLRLH